MPHNLSGIQLEDLVRTMDWITSANASINLVTAKNDEIIEVFELNGNL